MEQWVFVRSGRTNEGGILSPLGIIQAERRALQIGIKQFEAVVTSGTTGAVMTSQIFALQDLPAKRINMPQLLPKSDQLEELYRKIGYATLEEYHEYEEARQALETFGTEAAARLRDVLAASEGFSLIVGETPFLEQLGLALLQEPESDFANDNFTNIGLVEAGAFVIEMDTVGKVTKIDVYNEPIEG